MRALALAVHPDDETLGCGATLLRHVVNGDSIHWLIVTAVTEPDFTDNQAVQQERQIEDVRSAYGFDSFHWLKLPSTRLDTVPLNDIIRAIRLVVAEVRPDIVYVPNRSDAHSDHRVTFEASLSVMKSFYMSTLGVRRVLACEISSETDAAPALAEGAFVPNVFVDVTATLKRKLEIMSLFADQVHPGFQARGLSAIDALARHRGSAIGVEYAEAFMLLREIW